MTREGKEERGEETEVRIALGDEDDHCLLALDGGEFILRVRVVSDIRVYFEEGPQGEAGEMYNV